MGAHPPLSRFPIRTLIAAKNGPNLTKSPLSPGMFVNGARNVAFLTASRLGKRLTPRVDGLTSISVRPHQQSWTSIRQFIGAPIRTLIAAKDGHNWVNFPPSLRGVCVNGGRNIVFLSAIRVGEESRLANRWIGRNFGRIGQKSRASAHHLLDAPCRP